MPLTTSAAYDALDPFTKGYLMKFCEWLENILMVNPLRVLTSRLISKLNENFNSSNLRCLVSAMPKAFYFLLLMRLREDTVEFNDFNLLMQKFLPVFDKEQFTRDPKKYFDDIHNCVIQSSSIQKMGSYLGPDFFTLPINTKIEKIIDVNKLNLDGFILLNPSFAAEFFYVVFINTREDENISLKTAAFDKLKEHYPLVLKKDSLDKFIRYMETRKRMNPEHPSPHWQPNISNGFEAIFGSSFFTHPTTAASTVASAATTIEYRPRK